MIIRPGWYLGNATPKTGCTPYSPSQIGAGGILKGLGGKIKCLEIPCRRKGTPCDLFFVSQDTANKSLKSQPLVSPCPNSSKYFFFHNSLLVDKYRNSEQVQATLAKSTPGRRSKIKSLSSIGNRMKQGGRSNPAFSHRSINSGNASLSFTIFHISKTSFPKIISSPPLTLPLDSEFASINSNGLTYLRISRQT
ncbi:hypothetical protein V8G54_028887 [Vigna mungo]|uniref:Uncharacterized protein n=1 Tax=Vigna mungo TaxID=3915 RepID=A0AAQ3MTA2_VIGMU